MISVVLYRIYTDLKFFYNKLRGEQHGRKRNNVI